ncbi:hypothetical protein Ahy_A06g030216 [Arachis hypogaea]|uniref:Transposase MuDR plant domain-containing protein n=1 Tax=Arachis hypogaea TaxID=3818 RepID=A0A445CVK3_ARAHY|nr:hypothetical protein Ahy_A06g030216 [Arachis hypogaea]
MIDDRVMLKVYYHGQILLQTSEGVKFVCENPLDIIIPFTLSFEELKDVICEKMDSQISRRVSCILYRYPISMFGGFVQFQTKYVTDEASMQEIFSVYIESRFRISFIELYIEFKQSAADRDIELEDYNSDSKEEFESNYEVVDQVDDTMEADVADMENALANQHPFEESTFMRSLDLEAMHTPEFLQYVNVELPVMTDGEFTVEMEFSSSREVVIKVMKDYTIRRVREYKMRYQLLREWGETYTNWLNRIPHEQYILAFDGGYRWSHMTTNLVESINLVLKGTRNLLVTAFVKAMFYRLNELFIRKRAEAEAHINAGHVFSELVTSKLHMDQVRTVYRARFRPLGNPTTWPVYHGPRFIGNPFLRWIAKGRPRMTCFLNEMNTQMLHGLRRCKQYGVEGHNHSRCRQCSGASASPATQ